jgi:hypothetical protein
MVLYFFMEVAYPVVVHLCRAPPIADEEASCRENPNSVGKTEIYISITQQ